MTTFRVDDDTLHGSAVCIDISVLKLHTDGHENARQRNAG